MVHIGTTSQPSTFGRSSRCTFGVVGVLCSDLHAQHTREGLTTGKNHLAGSQPGFGGAAGGIAIDMTQLTPRVEGAGSCTALQNIACCARNLVVIVTGIVGNLLDLVALTCMVGLVAAVQAMRSANRMEHAFIHWLN